MLVQAGIGFLSGDSYNILSNVVYTIEDLICMRVNLWIRCCRIGVVGIGWGAWMACYGAEYLGSEFACAVSGAQPLLSAVFVPLHFWLLSIV